MVDTSAKIIVSDWLLLHTKYCRTLLKNRTPWHFMLLFLSVMFTRRKVL